MGAEDVAEEFIQEEPVIKDMAGKADASTSQHKIHKSETLREKLTIFARY